ncbi:hypothetical protein GLAREA_11802 [Glarea lozoyensis ATCC 20868]|uniref:Uncharacterized protein n=1 Tax=Glarea lozoyensis (strain ATCC 20868 / MF5171) TaxID=1116229 RepID=S3CZG7_GLAL2|nr:uncharacterized protein GLAREA_11802 [Glarea lozoyensis ATCC 20868]EPE25221.1 hypothetical protein GLAREA_11802 [Glarea lozoyensis ATCC 20868]
MCLPSSYGNSTGRSSQDSTIARYLSYENSPFPCERTLYLQWACIANGTETIDFLAEQQCFCGGGFFSASEGCDACYRAHGLVMSTSPEEEASYLSSLSTAECTPNPPTQGFTNLVATVDFSLIRTRSTTLSDDKFPNQTAVSNYFTTTKALTPGEVTGSATARRTSWTNWDGVRFTPTPVSNTGSVLVTSTGNGPPSSSTSSASSGGMAKNVPGLDQLVMMLFSILLIV